MNFPPENFIDYAIIASKLDEALQQLQKSKYFTEEQLDEEIEKWDAKYDN